MTKFEFIKAHRRTIAFALGTIVLAWAIIAGARALGSAINEHKISRLETEKQQFLKREDESRQRDLIMQGQIQALTEQNKILTAQLAESNQRITAAHSETSSARVDYEKARSNPPKFNRLDDAGRVDELGAVVQRLYPDSP